MSPAEQAAFHAGIRHAAEIAQISAVTIETRPGADHIRCRAAVEALRGLADGLKGVTFCDPPAVFGANDTGTQSVQEKGTHSVRTPVIPGSGENCRSPDLGSGEGGHSPHTPDSSDPGNQPVASREGELQSPPSALSREVDDVSTSSIASRDQARAAGFTGDACDRCGSFAMRRSGTCLTCQACGSTTGCS